MWTGKDRLHRGREFAFAASVPHPGIAAGYGGLSWKKVCALIGVAFADWPGMLYIYDEFKAGE